MAHVWKTTLTALNGAGGQMENGWTKTLKDAEESVKDVRMVII
jgi:hypothetical protein